MLFERTSGLARSLCISRQHDGRKNQADSQECQDEFLNFRAARILLVFDKFSKAAQSRRAGRDDRVCHSNSLYVGVKLRDV